MSRTPFVLVLLAALFFGVFTNTDARAASRYAAIIIDAETGTVLYSRNANNRLYPASLTKIMTMYMTFEALEDGRLRLDQPLRVSRRAAGQTPSRLGLRAGSTITVKQAMLAIVTKSANDAATVLAEALGGTESEFARSMTKRARDLGMSRTTFRNASGLPNRRQRSTARDMATLALAVLRDYPQYYGYFSQKSFHWNKRNYRNHNNLLRRYSGTDGIKTGYIRASGFNLVASVKRNGKRLIGVVFGGRSSRSRDNHMMKILDRSFAKRDVMVARAMKKRGEDVVVAKAQTKSKPQTKKLALVKPVSTSATIDITPPVKPEIKTAEAPRVAAKATTNDGPKKWIKPAADKSGNWGVQVGTFRHYPSAKKRVRQVALLAPTFLKDKGVAIVPVEQNDLTLYRAQLTGLEKREARKACRVLKKRRLACRVLSPNRIVLAMN